MCTVRAWWVLVAVAACGGFPKPQPELGDNSDGGLDNDGGFQDAAVGFDADPLDAFVPLDGPVVDGAPQGTPPTTGTVTVSGTADAGRTLTLATSGWDLGSPAGVYHYKWQRCSTSACTSTATVGGDSKTYTLASADGGYYIRAGAYAVNTCASGCGQTAYVYSTPVGPVRNVVTSKGASCYCNTSTCKCTSSACAYVKVSISGFSSSSHAVDLYSNYISGAWDTYTTSTFPSARACWGFSGKTVWSTVDGLKSNVITW